MAFFPIPTAPFDTVHLHYQVRYLNRFCCYSSNLLGNLRGRSKSYFFQPAFLPSQAVVSTMKVPLWSWHLEFSAGFTNLLLHTLNSLPEPPLNGPASRDALPWPRLFYLTTILQHLHQFAGLQVAVETLSLITLSVDLTPVRKLMSWKRFDRWCHDLMPLLGLDVWGEPFIKHVVTVCQRRWQP